MVTTEIKAIIAAGGGDYTTLGAWELAERINLVTADKIKVAEIYSGLNVGNVTLIEDTDWVTDVNHYPQIRAAAGHSNGGKYDTSKAFFNAATVRVNFMTIGPGLSFYGGIDINPPAANSTVTVERNVSRSNVGGAMIIVRTGGNPNAHIIRNNILIGFDGAVTNIQNISGKIKFYNNTVYATGFAGIYVHSVDIITDNNYLAQTGATPCYYFYGSETFNGHDATSNGEAATASLRNIAYSTANFVSVTAGSEDLHLKAGSALLLKGITLSDVTNDIDGDSRVGFVFDIGADQFDQIPLCWNYTARYKNSNKLFKASGCGRFPRTLRVPGNVDTGTGKMVDDGIEIDPDNYSVV